MKRNSVLKGIAVSVALSAFLTGCGGSSTTSDDSTTTTSPTLSPTTLDGKAVDGYLQYATVCLDLNNDGYCQNNEPNTQTDINGTFSLQITAQTQENENYQTAMLLVYGGKDADTGLDFTGKLLAPQEGDSIVVTPVTTLVAKTVQKEIETDPTLTEEQLQEKIALAKQKVAKALDIPEEDIDKDPIAEQKAGNEALVKTTLQLQKAVEALTVADPDVTQDDRIEDIYEALAQSLDDLQDNEAGVDVLLDKTLLKAQTDTELKTLLGGDQVFELSDAAKKVAENIETRFEGFSEEEKKTDDFLQKIATGTTEDLKQVEIAFKEGTLDEVTGQITVDDAIFSPTFDWNKEYIATDLKILDIDPTTDLITKIEEALGDEKIKPGILFEEYEKFENSTDTQLQEVYQKVLEYMKEQKAKEEAQEGKESAEIIKITEPMSIYMPEKDGYSQVSFTEEHMLNFKKYAVQEDGTFAEVQPTEADQEIIYKDGNWVTIGEYDPNAYILNDDGSITIPDWNERSYLLKGKDIADKIKEFPQYDISANMPANAEMYYVKIEKTDDFYSLYEPTTIYSENGDTTATSIGELIEAQCQTKWFIGDENGGLAFAGTATENGYTCDPTATSGKLVYASQDQDFTTEAKEGGTWEIKTLDNGIEVLIVKPYDPKLSMNDEGRLEYTIFSVKDGTLYRGDMQPKGTVNIMPAYNDAAMEALTSALTTKWEEIKNELPDGELTFIKK